MQLEQLCSEISLQPEVTREVLYRHEEFVQNGFYDKNKEAIKMLFERKSWDQGVELLQKQLIPENQGLRILTVMTACLCDTWEAYRKKGISDRIFTATMKCFPRFIEEYRTSYGSYGFDREFWTPRQLSMQLFRLGELEYELDEQEGKQVISIHIPSDAVMTPEKCRASYEQAKNFIKEFYPDWSDKEYGCNSWLLSPGLKKILPDTSNIICFQNGFEIVRVNEDDMEFLEWVYKRKDIPYPELPEDTSLQRNMKKYLLAGGKIGEADGILRADAWSGEELRRKPFNIE